MLVLRAGQLGVLWKYTSRLEGIHLSSNCTNLNGVSNNTHCKYHCVVLSSFGQTNHLTLSLITFILIIGSTQVSNVWIKFRKCLKKWLLWIENTVVYTNCPLLRSWLELWTKTGHLNNGLLKLHFSNCKNAYKYAVWIKGHCKVNRMPWNLCA